MSDPPDPLPKPATDCGRPPRTGRSAAADVAAVALASGATVKAAAGKAKVGERTLYSWMRRPAFARRVAQLRAAMVDAAVGLLSRDMTRAARVLGNLLKSEDETVRLRAARALLELGVVLREHGEFVDRLAAVEQRLADGLGGD